MMESNYQSIIRCATGDNSSIWRIFVEQAPWATIVVRAVSEAEAVELGQQVAETYTDSREGVTAERLDPNGPSAVLIDDWS